MHIMQSSCIFCLLLNKHTMCFMPVCEECHNKYWNFNHMLSVNQNDEIQIALLKKINLPPWFVRWWQQVNKFIVFV